VIDVSQQINAVSRTAGTRVVPAGHWPEFGPGATGIGWDTALVGLAIHPSMCGLRTAAPGRKPRRRCCAAS